MFRKTVATVVWGISKIPNVNFEIHSFFVIGKKFLFSSDTTFCHVGFRVQTERFLPMLLE